MDPFSITAGVVGIAAPALHGIRLLLADIQNIVDAPDTVKSLEGELRAIDQALTSLQAVSDPQWELLGESVVSQSKTVTTTCKESCDKFRVALGRWTRHSKDGKLSWQDRATVGIFKQSHISSISVQLQRCKTELTALATIATLHSSLQQKQVTGETMANVLATKTEIADSIAATNRLLAEANSKLGTLCLAERGQGETEADRTDAITQAAVEQTALGATHQLLEELLSGIQAAAAKAQKDEGRVVNHFGPQNEGMQVGVSYGAITFGRK